MSDENWAGADFSSGSAGAGGYLCRAWGRRGGCRRGRGREELLADGSVETTLICTADHEGGPGVAHGGWTAAMFDEVTGHVPLLNGQLSVTGTMRVTYVKPVPIERPLHARAWVTEKDQKRWYVQGELTLAS